MSEFWAYVQLGARHITDPRGLDHVLFLLALAVIYRLRDWRALAWVVTSFTIGHSVTLALAVTGTLAVPAPLIEFLIPVTIVATCIENLLVGGRGTARKTSYRPVLAAVFGLVHGAGFANYLTSLFVTSLAVPLLGFNIGVELGQLAVLVVAGALFALVEALLAAVRANRFAVTPLRLRVVAVSSVVALIAGRWAVERAPW